MSGAKTGTESVTRTRTSTRVCPRSSMDRIIVNSRRRRASVVMDTSRRSRDPCETRVSIASIRSLLSGDCATSRLSACPWSDAMSIAKSPPSALLTTWVAVRYSSSGDAMTVVESVLAGRPGREPPSLADTDAAGCPLLCGSDLLDSYKIILAYCYAAFQSRKEATLSSSSASGHERGSVVVTAGSARHVRTPDHEAINSSACARRRRAPARRRHLGRGYAGRYRAASRGSRR